MAVGGSGSPQLVSEQPGLHLRRSVLVHRDQGDDGGGDGDRVTFRLLLSDYLISKPTCDRDEKDVREGRGVEEQGPRNGGTKATCCCLAMGRYTKESYC